MAIQRDADYPGRWGTADADYPGGIPKNRTTPTSADGSYLEAKLWKDTYGFQDAAIAQGNITRSGNPETAQASDVLDGLKAVMAGQSLEWSATRNYNHPVIVSGSDDELYLSVQDSGPGSTVQDPTTDASDTYWILLADTIGGGGVAVWDSGVDYVNPVLVYGSDNRLYMSQADSGPSGVGAQNPTTDDGTYWRVLDNSFGYEILIIEDQKSPGTAGGTFTAGAWRTRDLNTVVENTITGASLSSNQVTLPAGTYRIMTTSPGHQVDTHKVRLQNITDATTVKVGTTEYSANGMPSVERSTVDIVVTISAPKAFEIQHYSELTRSTDGFGRLDVALDSTVETYSRFAAWKIR